MDEQQWPRLAQAVKDRRLKLGLSTRAAAAAAGINRATWASTEDEERRLSEHLWSGVEQALGWARGSIAAILRGGDPVTVEPERAPAGRLPAGFNLRDEYERIRVLAISCETKLTLLGEIIALYEQDRADQRPSRETRPA
jgi:hypothetical protein